jgi:hypothetical protein
VTLCHPAPIRQVGVTGQNEVHLRGACAMGVSAIDQARGQMPSNIDRYKKDLDALIAKGERVNVVMQHDCNP